jgi:hypothetical protein
MISAKLAGLFLALILVLTLLGIVDARQLFLNVYVDNTNAKKVLVVGNVDDPVGLAFLNSSEHIYEENGQLYAVTDSLLEKEDQYSTSPAALSSRRLIAPGGWSFSPAGIMVQ